MEVVEARVRRARVLERVDDVRGDEDVRPGRGAKLLRSRPEREGQLSLHDEEAVRVVVVDVGWRAVLTGAVQGLGDRELLAVHDEANATPGALGDRLGGVAGRSHGGEPSVDTRGREDV